ncbi:hypothetical protein [Pseudonocardia sp. TRM90224]|uniref:hypothetical protein n=1 Tax=Pseudonocardia sp. TRM90224 TaxID=2812678 RepID=UPI001E646262|nr:hypothetical protein [Pseudonocardia sp. TRM90224]
MAKVHVGELAVTVELAPWERPFAGGRERIEVPRGGLRSVEVVERPTRWSATPGGRSGLVVTGVLKVGRWGLGTGTRRFVSVRRWVPAVRLVLDDVTAGALGYDELLVSTPEAERVAAAVPSGR